jgi:hypothetical protein
LSNDRVTRGTVAQWDETKNWHDRDGLPLPDPMLVVGYITILRRWKDKRPEDITEQPLPDPEQLNNAIPVTEWTKGLDGTPEKPWKRTYVVYLVELKTGSLFTYANSTYGAMLAYTNLEEQIAVMRMLRGEHVYPIVHLEKRPMKTAYGMKTRPHLQPTGDWRAPGGLGAQVTPPSPAPQISGPSTPTLPASTPSTPAPTPPASTLSTPTPPSSATATLATAPPASSASVVLDNTKPVKPVTVGEYIADEL